MRIVIAGGSGFLGASLAAALAADKADVVVPTRGNPRPPSSGVRTVRWQPNEQPGAWHDAIDGATAVVNLAGESIAGKRWTPAHKQRVLDSRVHATRSLVDAIHARGGAADSLYQRLSGRLLRAARRRCRD